MQQSAQKRVVQRDTLAPDRISKQVERYRAWLAAQATRDSSNRLRECEEYAARASQAVEVGMRRIQTFAPFRYKYSALQTITLKQCFVLCGVGLIWLLGLVLQWKLTLTITLAAITVGYLAHLCLDIALAIGAFGQPSEEHIDDEVVAALHDAEWPPYTILCPLYREAQVVPQFVEAMKALDYPAEKLQILFLTETDDADTRTAIQAMHLPSHFKIVTVPDGSPRTKPRACNFGLIEATGHYVVIYDAEDVPDPLQIKKAVLTFARYGSDLACVQAKLNFYNPDQNLLTRWFTAEYSLWFDLILPGLQQARLAIPLGGTSNHFPTQTLRALGGWDAFNVTEDCDLGLRLAWFRLKTVILNSTTYEEANSRTKNWIRQRSRWIKGYMQTYLVHLREPLHYIRNKRLRVWLSLQLVIGGKAAMLFINPLMWTLLAIYICFYHAVSQVYSNLFPPPILYIAVICLLLGNFFYAYTYFLGCMRRKQYHLVRWMPLIPIYWIMTSIAACVALYQLILKPHYWEKTEHGFHLHQMAAKPDAEWEEWTQRAEELTLASTPELLSDADLASVQKYERLEAVPVASVQDTLAEMIALRRSAFLPSEQAALLQAKRPQKDAWFIATFICACMVSILSCWYYWQRHQILLYKEASMHLSIARSVIDSSPPFDFFRLGDVWLPVQHLAMLPFVWNDYLWRTGLAGSIPSMIGYVVVAMYVFLAGRRLTQDSRSGLIAALLFMLNPNILYLQSTPLNELVSIATLMAACYYFLAWAQSDRLKYLLLAAGSTCLATLTCYEGWALFLAFLVLLLLIGWVKRQSWMHIEGNVLTFGLLGSLGIELWLLWCGSVFGNPFYFLHGLSLSQMYASHTYQALWQPAQSWALSAGWAPGPILSILVLSALILFVVRQHRKPEMLAALALLVPFGCSVVVLLSSGQMALFPPQQAFNLHYGAEIVAPAAIFVATSLGGWRWRKLLLRLHWFR